MSPATPRWAAYDLEAGALLEPSERCLPSPVWQECQDLFGVAPPGSTSEEPVPLAAVVATLGEALQLSPPEPVLLEGMVNSNGQVTGRASQRVLDAWLEEQEPSLLLTPPGPALDSGVPLTWRRRRVKVAWLSAALDLCLGLPERLGRGELDIDAQRLFEAAILGSPLRLLNWRGVEMAARGLLRQSTDRLEQPGPTADAPTPERRWRLELTRDIARRHQGEAPVLPWPEDGQLESLTRALALEVIAHVVQAAADGSDEFSLSYSDTARACLARPGTEQPEDLKVMGAIGRALAAVEQVQPALAILERAIDGWLALDLAHQASFALCEYLRLAGIWDAPRVEPAMDRWVHRVEADERTDAISRTFLSLALGRAHCQSGNIPGGTKILNAPIDWTAAPPHVESARQRWLHFGHRSDELLQTREGSNAKPATAATAANRAMAALEEGRDGTQRALARLDWLLLKKANPDSVAPVLVDLLASQPLGYEAARLLRRIAPNHTPEAIAALPGAIRRLTSEFRY